MKRIEACFQSLKRSGRKGLIPFVTAGDPAPELTQEVLHALVRHGADMIELGMPFSDPMADGPVIQHASERAIARGVGLQHVLESVAGFRMRDSHTPIVLMGYLNPIFVYGPQFFADAARAGVDALLLVDCPVEETSLIQPHLDRYGLRQIHLIAPTTSKARRDKIFKVARGFVYYVSFKGITGAERLAFDEAIAALKTLASEAPLPLAVGFGIRDAQSAKALGDHADAVVIGSALVDQLKHARDAPQVDSIVASFLAPIRAALGGLEQAA
jgi:tryptophan synthase alpha chain